ncbi:RNA 2',3'-cyclic phosphodiesterase [bacterium]|nr:RNA 2',3'-cyclic phosphodiesterase [bacterium]
MKEKGLVRAFIAIQLPASIRERLIREVQAPLKQLPDKITFVKEENIHLTLRFLGEVPKEKLNELIRILDETEFGIPPFELTVKGIGFFGSRRSPRVIWVGTETKEELNALSQKIDQLVRSVGLPKRDHFFSPHLTLGRVRHTRDGEKIANILEKHDFSDRFTVDRFVVFKSQLTCEGPIHTALFSKRLQGGNDEEKR